jgi:hypothetical protein
VPAAGSSWFAPRAFEINSVSAQAGYRATRLVDAGPIDLSDGALWVDGAESLPAPEGSWYAVKAGTPHVTLLIADTHRGGGSVVAAVEIRLGEGRPVRWEQKPELAGGTDGGTMGVAGLAAARSLAAHRTFDQAVKELDTPNFWVTPCRRFFTLPAAQAAPAMALEITLTGDGGWPGAVGYDVDGHPVDVLISTTVLPWSDLGMPGTPPPQAVADEPTPSAS